jgi:hypothetical protein
MSTEQSTKDPPYTGPAFHEALDAAYWASGKNVVVLSGNIHDLNWCGKTGKFEPLEQTLYNWLESKFTVMKLDAAAGITFFKAADRRALVSVCDSYDNLPSTDPDDKVGDLKALLNDCRNSPLPALGHLRDLLRASHEIRVREKADRAAKEVLAREKGEEAAKSGQVGKPLCVIIRDAGSIFPPGAYGQLSEIYMQRLVTFRGIIEDPDFKRTEHLFILLADTRSEINSKINELPLVRNIEIGMPTDAERKLFVSGYKADGEKKDVTFEFEKGADGFIEDAQGLPLTALEEMLRVASRTGKAITSKSVLDQITKMVESLLPGIATIKKIELGPEEIIGYKSTGEIFRRTFKRCENRKTAIPVVIISGANGSGKSFQAEAYGGFESRRLVLILSGLRDKYYGGTDALFEKLRLLVRSLGRILIMVDEAHTQFGSVHKSDTHETEKRLSGNIIQMMSDPSYLVKVVWVLMSSRPDELDPDILSRSPVQIPIFDLLGEERKAFVKELFARKGIAVPEDDLKAVIDKTAQCSNRDLDNLAKEALSLELSVLQTLDIWQPPTQILGKREMQRMIAAQNCTYPGLLPDDLKNKVGTKEFEREVKRLTLEFAS